jgi:LSD1 subclass zinc finger protein
MDGGMRPADERVAAGESVADALRLDGNAAAGILSEIFVPDLTAALATCGQCGATQAVGALLVYAHGMGTVVRCASCDAVVLCVTRTPTRVWLDPTGVRRIMMTATAPPP